MTNIRRARDRIGQIEGAQLTRLMAVVSVFTSALAIVISGWFMVALWDGAHVVRHSKVARKLDENFDSIAAAAAVGRLDILAVLLTFLGIVAAIALIYGWTAFRSTARQAAITEVDEQLPEALAELIREQGHLLVGKALEDDQLVARLQERFTQLGIDDTETAIGVDDDPDYRGMDK